MKKPESNRMIVVTVHLPKIYIEVLDHLVKQRLYPNRAEAIRTAVRDMILNEIDLLGRPREEKDVRSEVGESEEF